jgi:hypothetical protein
MSAMRWKPTCLLIPLLLPFSQKQKHDFDGYEHHCRKQQKR